MESPKVQKVSHWLNEHIYNFVYIPMCIYVCILIWCIDLKTDSAPVDTRDPSSIFLNTVNEILLPQPTEEKTQEHSRCCKSQHRNYLLIKAFHHVFSLDFIEACLTYLSKDNWPIFIRSGILSSSGAVTPTGLHPRFLEPKKSKGTLAPCWISELFFYQQGTLEVLVQSA